MDEELTDDDYCDDCRLYHKGECEYDTDGTKLSEETKKTLRSDKEMDKEMDEKKWFITKDDDGKSKVRWAKLFIRKDIEWDCDKITHLIVSMHNNLNAPSGTNDCKIESIQAKNFFRKREEAEIEIMRRERFGE